MSNLKNTYNKVKSWISEFLHKYFFDEKWKCNICRKEIFDGKYFCDKCYNKLPFNDKVICEHCGRQTINPTEYCLTCKNTLVNIDKGRSLFVYDKPINKLIKDLKYNNKQYFALIFAEMLSVVYFKNLFTADYIVFPPMTEKSFKKRGYNQSELISNHLSEFIKVPIFYGVKKVKETERQARLNREERLKNLEGAFRVFNKKEIKGKDILIVDDVTTTGATAECIATVLKKSKVNKVYLLTVASTRATKAIL